jgi:hypothetical protein
VKLPNEARAVVAEEKVTNYLLSTTHPVGRWKAAYFIEHGFSVDRPDELIGALLIHAAEHEVAEMETTDYGTIFTIEGPLETPSGRRPGVRSVWIVTTGIEFPRLVTAYPSRGDRP